MAVNYANITRDFQTLINGNISTIIASGTSANIDWNEGIVFDYKTAGVSEWIAPSVVFATTDQQELTGDDVGVYVEGFLVVNIFKTLASGGNNITGLDIATKVNTIIGKLQATNNAVMTTEILEITANELDPQIADVWLTGTRVAFRASVA